MIISCYCKVDFAKREIRMDTAYSSTPQRKELPLVAGLGIIFAVVAGIASIAYLRSNADKENFLSTCKRDGLEERQDLGRTACATPGSKVISIHLLKTWSVHSFEIACLKNKLVTRTGYSIRVCAAPETVVRVY